MSLVDSIFRSLMALSVVLPAPGDLGDGGMLSTQNLF